MITIIGKLFGAGFAVMLATSAAYGQYVRVDLKTPGYGTDVFYGASYEKRTTVTFKAKIHGISRTPGRKAGEASDVALLVAPFSMAPDRYGKQRMVFGDGYLNVELGPEWFVDVQTTKLHVNDLVEITGSRMIMDGQRVVMAESVRHGHNILALRRLSGMPYWYAFREDAVALRNNPAGTAASDGTPPILDQDSGLQYQGFSLGGAAIYGDAYSISGSNNIQPGVFGGNAQRVQPVGGPPLIILGNPYYNGPYSNVVYPVVYRF